jgi:bifunctional UDP-N-acetylglucosamine pyrophosphorylase/glucosamine-1-phosphate N-acetyltransferase
MENLEKIKIIILAGGKGKRMQSDLPKVLVKLNEKPIIKYILKSIEEAFNQKPVAIIGYKAGIVESELNDSCFYVTQKEQLGTGHAVSCAKEYCKDVEHIIVLSGDQPLISPETLKNLLKKHLEAKTKITFTTTEVLDFNDWRKSFIAFGRILRKNGEIVGIREYRDASEEEKLIKEVNAGSYAFDANWLWKNLEKINNNNIQNEYYLTDLLHIASLEKEKIEAIQIESHEALGANTKEELEILEEFTV